MQNKILTKPPKIVFFDIDDTLYVKNKDYIPETTIYALQALQKNNIKVAIATGRTLKSFPKKLLQLMNELQINILVTINGQYNLCHQQLISSCAMSQEDCANISAFFQSNNIRYGFVGKDGMAVDLKTDYLQEALDPIDKNYLEDPTFFKTNPVYQMLAFFATLTASQQNELTKILGNKFKTLRWHHHAIDLLDNTASKIKGIQSVLQHLNIALDDCMAFGDGNNDMEMLTHVGYGVALGNAVDSLKEVADYVTTSIEDDGVYNALTNLKVIESK